MQRHLTADKKLPSATSIIRIIDNQTLRHILPPNQLHLIFVSAHLNARPRSLRGCRDELGNQGEPAWLAWFCGSEPRMYPKNISLDSHDPVWHLSTNA